MFDAARRLVAAEVRMEPPRAAVVDEGDELRGARIDRRLLTSWFHQLSGGKQRQRRRAAYRRVRRCRVTCRSLRGGRPLSRQQRIDGSRLASNDDQRGGKESL